MFVVSPVSVSFEEGSTAESSVFSSVTPSVGSTVPALLFSSVTVLSPSSLATSVTITSLSLAKESSNTVSFIVLLSIVVTSWPSATCEGA
ncbi:hypothetical protein D3C77_734630 [compost metagenome]